MSKEVVLRAPLSNKAVRKLNAGDIVYISGVIWSSRSSVCMRFIDENKALPIDSKLYNIMIFGGEGLLPADDGSKWKPLFLSTTVGLRFEKWVPELIRRGGIKAFIVKGNMGPLTIEACRKYLCVQLTPYGWVLVPRVTDVVKEVKEVFWRDLGLSEALVVYEVERSGPWMVNIDTRGKCMYNEIYKKVENKVSHIYEALKLKDFKYTKLES